MKSKRSRRNKTKKAAARVIGATIKGTLRMTMITAVSATLLLYPNNIMYTTAYFTSGTVRSGTISFELEARRKDINALVDYQQGSTAPPATMFAMGEQTAIPGELFSVIAYICFPVDCGFEVDDIDIRSIKLHYNRHTASVLAGTARFEGSALVVEFDWDAVEGWLEDLEPGESPEFRVTGEGVREEDGREFTFSADNIIEINREEIVEITGIEIFGPGDIVIPMEGEGVYDLHQYGFMVFDTEGEEISGEEVIWSVIGPGVRISQDGMLTVTPAAAPGNVMVTATLNSDGSVQGSLEVVLTAPEEILEEIPPEELLPEEMLPTDELPPPLELVPEEELGEEQPPVEEEVPGEEVPGEELPPAEELHPPKEDGEDAPDDDGADTGEGDTGDEDTGDDGSDGDHAGDGVGDGDGDQPGDGSGDEGDGPQDGDSDDVPDQDDGDTGEGDDGTDESDIGDDDTDDSDTGDYIDEDEGTDGDEDGDDADEGPDDADEGPDDDDTDYAEDAPNGEDGGNEDDTAEDDGGQDSGDEDNDYDDNTGDDDNTISGEEATARGMDNQKYVYRGGYLWEIV
ncbi:MAG: hypothetical protein PHP19_09140 [Firmicutes bacterium]|nr:hypothetical protein [Bacillota bacterium]